MVLCVYCTFPSLLSRWPPPKKWLPCNENFILGWFSGHECLHQDAAVYLFLKFMIHQFSDISTKLIFGVTAEWHFSLASHGNGACLKRFSSKSDVTAFL